MTDTRDNWEKRLFEAFNNTGVGPSQKQIEYIKNKSIISSRSTARTMILAGSALVVIMAFVVFGSSWFRQQTHFTSSNSISEQQLMEILSRQDPNEVGDILYQENWGNDGVLVFSRYMHRDREEMDWRADYVRTTNESLNWVGGGILNIELPTRIEMENDLYPTFTYRYIKHIEGTPFPLLYGDYLNPALSKIRVIQGNGDEIPARMIRNASGGHSLWFAFLSEAPDSSTVIEGLNEKGEVIDSQEYREQIDTRAVSDGK
ncbi:hypothetical protein [Cohnella panacarvi]|uniref:hypothetical protein n=1 Tax=Cohnella panacarvi TaxID=400776 RepID=UPI00047D990E|nr:hypothetical protein [Cohnella panacarvi]